MHIYAIADLHLSGEPPSKPMEIFGSHWAGHKDKIKAAWLGTVTDEDAVIIAGDISWAMGLKNAVPDLSWLAELPGRKLLLRGNHDYWWNSLVKMQQLFGDSFEFIQNNCIMIGRIAVCGTRGWILPSSENFMEDDGKIYNREGIRLQLSLEAAAAHNPERIIAALHYPPLFPPRKKPYSPGLWKNTALPTAYTAISMEKTTSPYLKGCAQACATNWFPAIRRASGFIKSSEQKNKRHAS